MPVLGVKVFLHGQGQPEIEQFDPFIGEKHHVFRLDVAVDHKAVGVVQAREHLLHHAHGETHLDERLFRAVALEHVAQGLPRGVLH